jgi:uncharacterized membrane protein
MVRSADPTAVRRGFWRSLVTRPGLRSRLLGNPPLSTGQIVILIAMLVSGIVVALLSPIGAGFDEAQHLRRVWEMSYLELVPNSLLGPDRPIPALFATQSYREDSIVRPVASDYFSKYLHAGLGDEGFVYDDTSTRSVYSPLLLIPQAIVMRYTSLAFHWPALVVIWMTRLAGLLAYLAFVFLAVRTVPWGKWILLILAAAPTAVYQAATVSADSIANGIGFLFVAVVLCAVDRSALGWKDLAALTLALVLLFSGKINMVPLAVLPLLLVKPADFDIRGGYLLLMLVTVGLLVLEVFGWYALVYSPSTGGGGGMLGQLRYLATHPSWYLLGIAKDVLANGLAYLRGWVASFGYYYWSVPALIVPVYLLVLIVTVGTTDVGASLDRSRRLILMAVFVVGFLGTAISLQLTAEPVGSSLIHELHGRYFTPLALPAMLAVAGIVDIDIGRYQWWLIGGVGFSLTLFSSALWLAYHVTCGTAFYTSGLCYMPQYKNWAPGDVLSPPIDRSRQLRQAFTAECDGLTQVRVWVVRESEASGPALSISVIPSTGQAPLATELAGEGSIPASGWLRVDFDPAWHSADERYQVVVKGVGQGGSSPVRLSYTSRPEYRAGSLSLDGRALEQDLFFQYGCSAGWNRLGRTLKGSLQVGQ